MVKFQLSLLLILSSIILSESCRANSESESESSDSDCSSDDSGDSYDLFEVLKIGGGCHNGHNHHENAVCPSGWQIFDRVRSPWCIKIFQSVGDNVDELTAQEYCRREGAVLTGIEDSDETNYIQEQGLEILQTLNLKNGSLWIGGKRRDECLAMYKVLPECLPSANRAFEWSDNHTTGKSQFNWAPSQPDYLIEKDTNVIMHLFASSGIDGITTGSMNDVPSSAFYNWGYWVFEDIVGYACGKQALPANV